jgi:hypothetical protein
VEVAVTTDPSVVYVLVRTRLERWTSVGFSGAVYPGGGPEGGVPVAVTVVSGTAVLVFAPVSVADVVDEGGGEMAVASTLEMVLTGAGTQTVKVYPGGVEEPDSVMVT